MNYSQTSQLNLLKNIGFESPSWEDLIYLLCAIVVSASLVGAGWSAWDRHRQDPWLRLLARAARQLQRTGVVIGTNSTPRQLALALEASAQADQPKAQALQHWLLQLEALRYAPGASAKSADYKRQLAALQRQWRRLR